MSIEKKKNNIILLFVGIVLTLFLSACSSDENNPIEPTNEADVIGVWKQTSKSWTTSYDCGCYSEEKLDSLGIIWELTFNEDKSAKQITGISDSLTTQIGTWSMSGDKLTLTLKAPTKDEEGTIIYACSVKNNLLTLCWTITIGTEFSSEFKKQ